MSDTNPNVAALLPVLANRHGSRPALIEWRRGRRRETSFQELAERVALLAGTYRARGLSPGDRMLVFIPMSTELYITLLACWTLGITAVFLDAWADRRRLNLAVEAAAPRAFAGSPRAHLLRLLSPALRRISLTFVASDASRPSPHSVRPADPQQLAPQHAALVTLTTGSTGPPRSLSRSHHHLRAQHRALSRLFELTPEDRDLPTLPIFALNSLAAGIPVVLADVDHRRPAHLAASEWLRVMDAEQITTFGGSPATIAAVVSASRRRDRPLPLRRLFVGGAPVDAHFARDVLAAGDFHGLAVYGSTEAEPIAAISLRELAELDGEGVCVGRPVPEAVVRLLGDDTGEVSVSGEHVLAEPGEASACGPVLHDGDRVWRRIGDAARWDDAGRLWLLGRVGDCLRRDGKVWWPLPAEQRARAGGGVRAAVYIGLPQEGDSHGGTGHHGGVPLRAVLCVEPVPGLSPDLAELRRLLAPWPLDEVRIVPRIPRDPRHASKPDRAALLERMKSSRGVT